MISPVTLITKGILWHSTHICPVRHADSSSCFLSSGLACCETSSTVSLFSSTPGIFAGRWTSWSMTWCQHWRRALSRLRVVVLVMEETTRWRWAVCWRGRLESGGAENDARTTRIHLGTQATSVRVQSLVWKNIRCVGGSGLKGPWAKIRKTSRNVVLHNLLF